MLIKVNSQCFDYAFEHQWVDHFTFRLCSNVLAHLHHTCVKTDAAANDTERILANAARSCDADDERRNFVDPRKAGIRPVIKGSSPSPRYVKYRRGKLRINLDCEVGQTTIENRTNAAN